MVINGIHAQIQSLAVDTQKQCNQLFSQHTVDMNILMLYVFLVSCERRYRLSTAENRLSSTVFLYKTGHSDAAA